MPQCEAIKKDKKRCGSPCRKGSAFCFFHDPATREAHKAATQKGGRVCPLPPPTLPADTPDAPLANNHDVRAFVAETMNQLRTGKLAVNVANALFQGASVLIKAIEGSELEQRVEALEARKGKVK